MAVLLVLLLGGCAGPVQLPAPTPAAAAAATCSRLMAHLPDTVLDQHRRDTTADLTAAWGDPPITLSCGVPAPAGLGPSSQCFEVNQVGWYAEKGNGGYLFDTIGRSVVVQVGVPDHYAPEANALVDLAAAIKQTVPEEHPCG